MLYFYIYNEVLSSQMHCVANPLLLFYYLLFFLSPDQNNDGEHVSSLLTFSFKSF